MTRVHFFGSEGVYPELRKDADPETTAANLAMQRGIHSLRRASMSLLPLQKTPDKNSARDDSNDDRPALVDPNPKATLRYHDGHRYSRYLGYIDREGDFKAYLTFDQNGGYDKNEPKGDPERIDERWWDE